MKKQKNGFEKADTLTEFVDKKSICGIIRKKIHHLRRNIDLEKENKQLKEALRFYADKKNWYDRIEYRGDDRNSIWKDSENVEELIAHVIFGGKLARSVLGKLEKKE
jgi:hypothetical protein